MKALSVLIVNSHIPWGGLGQFTLSLAQGLKSEGYEVHGLVTHSDEDNFNAFKHLTSTTTYVGNLGKLAKYIAVLKLLWKLKPDVTLINYNAVIHFLLPFIPKSRVIDIIHNDVEDFYRISKINHHYVNAWVAPTPGIKEGYIKYAGLPRAKNDTVVISHGISQSKTVRPAYNETELNLAFVGAVYEHKGADMLPQIMEKILAVVPYAKLRIIGSGKLESALKSEFESKGMSKSIEFMGVIPHEGVRETLAQSDILLFPTRVEAFGLVIAEAMMEGAVPVVTLLPGITDATVENGETGYLISKDDVETFAKKVIDLARDRNLLVSMSNRCKIAAQEHLSLSTMGRNYRDLIEKMSN
ncbi:MAG: glycosyltransferase family 4 protein [Sulfuricurvum sp.]|nr:glycosyltransferase family 4 protein [Sulfuricurvum sp.]